jgi:hypothetical protein
MGYSRSTGIGPLLSMGLPSPSITRPKSPGPTGITARCCHLGSNFVRITLGVNITDRSKPGHRALCFDYQTDDIGHLAVGLDSTGCIHAPVIFGQTEGRCHFRLFTFLLWLFKLGPE